jgi:hypothetical protein
MGMVEEVVGDQVDRHHRSGHEKLYVSGMRFWTPANVTRSRQHPRHGGKGTTFLMKGTAMARCNAIANWKPHSGRSPRTDRTKVGASGE